MDRFQIESTVLEYNDDVPSQFFPGLMIHNIKKLYTCIIYILWKGRRIGQWTFIYLKLENILAIILIIISNNYRFLKTELPHTHAYCFRFIQ